MPTQVDPPLVLVVDDEEDVADTYALRIQSEYDTRVAYGGEQALSMLDDDVDAVLLDRRMPDLHGDEVLAELRDRGYDCTVILLTAVDPDLNILEMEFDDYLSKPVAGDALIDCLDQHIETKRGDADNLDELLSVVSKVDVLQDRHSLVELEESEEYRRLIARVEELAPIVREEVDDLDRILETFRSINR